MAFISVFTSKNPKVRKMLDLLGFVVFCGNLVWTVLHVMPAEKKAAAGSIAASDLLSSHVILLGLTIGLAVQQTLLFVFSKPVKPKKI